MEQIGTIGLDIAKNLFQLHGVEEGGSVVLQRQLRRRQVLSFFERHPPCLVGADIGSKSPKPNFPASQSDQQLWDGSGKNDPELPFA